MMDQRTSKIKPSMQVEDKPLDGEDPRRNIWTYKPLIPPIYLSTTYETFEPGKAHYEYSRGTNPTRDALHQALAALETAKYSLTSSSGLGSLTTCMFLVGAGNHVLCCNDVYGGTHRFFAQCAPKMGIEATFVEGTHVGNWVRAFKPGKTKSLWIESPTNPTMQIMDIENIAKEIKKLDPECLIVVDNTFMTPILQSPLEMGADIVMHSVTKYINGHSDVIMGCLMTNDQRIYDQLKFYQNALGIIPAPTDCSMVLRSISTLELRVKRQSESALKIARYLSGQPRVQKLLYPGLESHPQHNLAKKQFKHFGGMISFYLRQKNEGDSVRFVQALKKFHIAVSLGCVHSLIEIPSLMTHSSMSKVDLDKLEITDNLLRLSIGLEDAEVLIKDLELGFEVCDQIETSPNCHLSRSTQ